MCIGKIYYLYGYSVQQPVARVSGMTFKKGVGEGQGVNFNTIAGNGANNTIAGRGVKHGNRNYMQHS